VVPFATTFGADRLARAEVNVEFECGAVLHTGVAQPATSASKRGRRIVLHREGNTIREPVRSCSSSGRVDEDGGENRRHRELRIGEGTAD